MCLQVAQETKLEQHTASLRLSKKDSVLHKRWQWAHQLLERGAVIKVTASLVQECLDVSLTPGAEVSTLQDQQGQRVLFLVKQKHTSNCYLKHCRR
jgi:hypothetical protein